MEGTLIIDGNRPLKDKAKNGIADIDTILKGVSGVPFEDHIFLFQQIPYACGTTPDGNVNWDCTDKVGEIEQYKGQFGSSTWPNSPRFTIINGIVQPTITAETGKIQRWRMIHGGVRDTINLKVAKSKQLLPTQHLALAAPNYRL